MNRFIFHFLVKRLTSHLESDLTQSVYGAGLLPFVYELEFLHPQRQQNY